MEPRTSCSASQELNNYTTAAPYHNLEYDNILSKDYRDIAKLQDTLYYNNSMKISLNLVMVTPFIWMSMCKHRKGAFIIDICGIFIQFQSWTSLFYNFEIVPIFFKLRSSNDGYRRNTIVSYIYIRNRCVTLRGLFDFEFMKKDSNHNVLGSNYLCIWK